MSDYYTHPCFFWLIFVWNVFFHPLTFNLFVSLNLKWVSYRQHILGPHNFIHFINLCLLIRKFNLFTFCAISYLKDRDNADKVTCTETKHWAELIFLDSIWCLEQRRSCMRIRRREEERKEKTGDIRRYFLYWSYQIQNCLHIFEFQAVEYRLMTSCMNLRLLGSYLSLPSSGCFSEVIFQCLPWS